MDKGRLEAFSDGVIAIIITIMVLDMKTPEASNWKALISALPQLISYLVSFIYVGIFWNSHHHIFHATHRVSAGLMWANLALLFWMSLMPFSTGWVSRSNFAPLPTAMYGVVLLMIGIFFWLLERIIITNEGPSSVLAKALGNLDGKGLLAVVLYAIAIPLAFEFEAISQAIYIGVAILYLVPDRRIEQHLNKELT